MADNLTHVLVTDALPAVIVTMNRPEQRNALSTGLMHAMTEQLECQSARPECRVIIIKGAGPAFSAGHDLREMLNRTPEQEREIFDVCTRMMQTIQRIPQPVIASVHSIATAAGCQLVATCDLAIASENAKFATPGVKIGLFCSTPQVALSRNIGRKRALEMLLTGKMIDAATAAEWGLVNRVVPAEKLDEQVLELARQIASASPLTLRVGKQSFYLQIDAEQETAYELMAQTMAENAMTCDAQEGMSAFLEKRAPVWRGE
ncbi:MAG: enoyl-CoA hydratase [Chloroflexi bacterium]|nr:enoyl-CoA hydratase [Chloroflexota bacterium]